MTWNFRTTTLLKTAAMILAGLASTHSTALANTTYDLTFTPTSGSATGGSGTVTFENPITANGSYSTPQLVAIAITVDGYSFSLSQDPGASIQFGSSVTGSGLSDISFNFYVTEGPTDNIDFAGQANGANGYSITVDGYNTISYGNVTFNGTPVSAAPEPSSALLAGAALCMFPVYRFRKSLGRLLS